MFVKIFQLSEKFGALQKGQGGVSASVQFSCSVMSDSLLPHESQHARPPCPSPTPRVHSNSRPSSRWCHPAISSSVVPFSSCPQSLPASESFPMSQLFAWGGQKYWSFSFSIVPSKEIPYHVKLNDIYQIDSRAVHCQILLKKKCNENIVKCYKLCLIRVTKENVLGHLMRVFSFRSLWRSWKREVEEKKLDMMRMTQKRKGDRWNDRTQEKNNAFSMFKYLGNKKFDTWGSTMKSLHTSRAYYTGWSTERER